jgi:hypothetical protein
MKKKVFSLAVIILVSAGILLFTGCLDGNGRPSTSYIGSWEYVDISQGINPNGLDEDDEKEVFQLNGDGTWQITEYWYTAGSTWNLIYLMRGTYTVSGDTFTVTVEELSIPSIYGPNVWFDDTYWSDPINYYYLYLIYYDYFYNYMGANPFDVTYSLSSDGNTLFLTYGLDTISYTRL